MAFWSRRGTAAEEAGKAAQRRYKKHANSTSPKETSGPELASTSKSRNSQIPPDLPPRPRNQHIDNISGSVPSRFNDCHSSGGNYPTSPFAAETRKSSAANSSPSSSSSSSSSTSSSASPQFQPRSQHQLAAQTDSGHHQRSPRNQPPQQHQYLDPRQSGVSRSQSQTRGSTSRRDYSPQTSLRPQSQRQRANSHGAESLGWQPIQPLSPPALPPCQNPAKPSPTTLNINYPYNASSARRPIDAAALATRPANQPSSPFKVVDYSSDSESGLHPRHHRDRSHPPPTNRSTGHTRSRSASHSRLSSRFSIFGNLSGSSSSRPQTLLSPETAKTLQRPLKKAGAAVAAVAGAARQHHRRSQEEARETLAVDSDSDSDWGTGRRRHSSLVEQFHHAFSSRERRRSVENMPQRVSSSNGGPAGARGETAGPSRQNRQGHSRVPSVPVTMTQPAGWLGDKAQVTGPCITCGNTMKWDEGATAFLCKGCAMINDLVPAWRTAQARKNVEAAFKAASEAPAGSKIPRKPVGSRADVSHMVTPINVEHTQELIRKCITAYILDQFNPHPSHLDSAGKKRQRDPSNKIEPKYVFLPVEQYVSRCILDYECMNRSFSTVITDARDIEDQIPYTGAWSPHIDWPKVDIWYNTIINAAETWHVVYSEMEPSLPSKLDLVQLENNFLIGQERLQKALLKQTEQLLKRPNKLIKIADDFRFLLIVLENPLLRSKPTAFMGLFQAEEAPMRHDRFTTGPDRDGAIKPLTGYHSGIIKRIIGLYINAPDPQQQKIFIQWFSGFTPARFNDMREIVTGFLVYRLKRSVEKSRLKPTIAPPTSFDELLNSNVPEMSRQPGHSVENLTATLGAIRASDATYPLRIPLSQDRPQLPPVPHNDWQVISACRFLSLMWSANNLKRSNINQSKWSPKAGHIGARGQIVPTSEFYVSYLDLMDIQSDFRTGPSRDGGNFSICSYPFLLGVAIKKTLIEYDSRFQQYESARTQALDEIMLNRELTKGFVLQVNRNNIVSDSLQALRLRALNTPRVLKQQLKIKFEGEEGVDYGGLRKDWFMKLTREMFDEKYRLFTYDETSNQAYFNPNATTNLDEFRMLGIVLALAIYNSCILNIPMPSFIFRKLLAAAPTSTGHPWPKWRPELADLAELRPSLASGLKMLLDYDGDDFNDTFGDLTFEVQMMIGGKVKTYPLCPNGLNRSVTTENRQEYVDAYVKWELDHSVAKAFDAFQSGFFDVFADGSRSLSLCRPEEIELLICGSTEPLDVDSLQAVATYDGWNRQTLSERGGPPLGNPRDEPVVQWFWDSFKKAGVEDQRNLLAFITGSDRVPAGGTAALTLKINCLGDDQERLPSARTCFNSVGLYRYRTRQALENRLWLAVRESEGFGFS